MYQIKLTKPPSPSPVVVVSSSSSSSASLAANLEIAVCPNEPITLNKERALQSDRPPQSSSSQVPAEDFRETILQDSAAKTKKPGDEPSSSSSIKKEFHTPPFTKQRLSPAARERIMTWRDQSSASSSDDSPRQRKVQTDRSSDSDVKSRSPASQSASNARARQFRADGNKTRSQTGPSSKDPHAYHKGHGGTRQQKKAASIGKSLLSAIQKEAGERDAAREKAKEDEVDAQAEFLDAVATVKDPIEKALGFFLGTYCWQSDLLCESSALLRILDRLRARGYVFSFSSRPECVLGFVASHSTLLETPPMYWITPDALYSALDDIPFFDHMCPRQFREHLIAAYPGYITRSPEFLVLAREKVVARVAYSDRFEMVPVAQPVAGWIPIGLRSPASSASPPLFFFDYHLRNLVLPHRLYSETGFTSLWEYILYHPNRPSYTEHFPDLVQQCLLALYADNLALYKQRVNYASRRHRFDETLIESLSGFKSGAKAVSSETMREVYTQVFKPEAESVWKRLNAWGDSCEARFFSSPPPPGPDGSPGPAPFPHAPPSVPAPAPNPSEGESPLSSPTQPLSSSDGEASEGEKRFSSSYPDSTAPPPRATPEPEKTRSFRDTCASELVHFASAAITAFDLSRSVLHQINFSPLSPDEITFTSSSFPLFRPILDYDLFGSMNIHGVKGIWHYLNRTTAIGLLLEQAVYKAERAAPHFIIDFARFRLVSLSASYLGYDEVYERCIYQTTNVYVPGYSPDATRAADASALGVYEPWWDSGYLHNRNLPTELPQAQLGVKFSWQTFQIPDPAQTSDESPVLLSFQNFNQQPDRLEWSQKKISVKIGEDFYQRGPGRMNEICYGVYWGTAGHTFGSDALLYALLKRLGRETPTKADSVVLRLTQSIMRDFSYADFLEYEHAPVDLETYRLDLMNMNPASRRKHLTYLQRVLEGREETEVPKYDGFFVKFDEMLLNRKPRLIINPPPQLFYRLYKGLKSIKDRLKCAMECVYAGFQRWYEADDRVVYFSYGADMDWKEKSVWFDNAMSLCRSGEKLVFCVLVGGDDNLVVFGDNTFVHSWESDVTACDQSHNADLIGLCVDFFTSLRCDPRWIQDFLDAYSRPLKSSGIKVRFNHPQLHTGHPQTSVANTVLIGILASVAMASFDVTSTDWFSKEGTPFLEALSEHVEEYTSAMGMTWKIQTHSDPYTSTFHKGCWVASLEGRSVWVPLPSCLWKMTKLRTHQRLTRREMLLRLAFSCYQKCLSPQFDTVAVTALYLFEKALSVLQMTRLGYLRYLETQLKEDWFARANLSKEGVFHEVPLVEIFPTVPRLDPEAQRSFMAKRYGDDERLLAIVESFLEQSEERVPFGIETWGFQTAGKPLQLFVYTDYGPFEDVATDCAYVDHS